MICAVVDCVVLFYCDIVLLVFGCCLFVFICMLAGSFVF